MPRMTKPWLPTLLAAAALCLPAELLAQAQSAGGAIEGTVTDESGRRAPRRHGDGAPPGDRHPARDHHRRQRHLPRAPAAGGHVRGDGRAVGLRDHAAAQPAPDHRPDAARRHHAQGRDRAGGGHGHGGGADPGGHAHAPGVHGGRAVGGQPAGQRPQLHRLRAHHARREPRHARRRHQLRRPARHAQQPRDRRRRQQQHVLRPDAGPHGLRPRALPVQPGRRAGVPGEPQRLLGRVRARRRSRHQRRHQVGHQRPARLGLRVLPGQVAEREQLQQQDPDAPPRQGPLPHPPVRRRRWAARSSRTARSSSRPTTGSGRPSPTT